MKIEKKLKIFFHHRGSNHSEDSRRLLSSEISTRPRPLHTWPFYRIFSQALLLNIKIADILYAKRIYVRTSWRNQLVVVVMFAIFEVWVHL